MDRNEQLRKWKDMIEHMFTDKVPLNKEWTYTDNIIHTLDQIGKHEALNHTFLPDGGGLDLMGCSYANESGCIEMSLDGMRHIVRPKKLTFQWFPNADYEWAYFLLEADTLDSIFPNPAFKEEELVEVEPGEYIERMYWDAGEYKGCPLPNGARLVARYIKGKFVIFNKASLYNKNPETYDGRHDKMSPEGFKKHIEEVIDYLKEQEKQE